MKVLMTRHVYLCSVVIDHEEETLTDVAGKIATALSPTPNPHTSLSSPIKSAELRGKYIQQLKDMVNLRDLGALTEEEYQEHRSIIVNLMKTL